MILGFSDNQLIAIGAESEDRLDRVPPVGQLASNVKREIELRRRDLLREGQGAALAGVSPEASLALIRPEMSSSAVISAASQANRASKRRPDLNKASPRCSWISAWSGSFAAARCNVV